VSKATKKLLSSVLKKKKEITRHLNGIPSSDDTGPIISSLISRWILVIKYFPDKIHLTLATWRTTISEKTSFELCAIWAPYMRLILSGGMP
jgi:hypothetical protein